MKKVFIFFFFSVFIPLHFAQENKAIFKINRETIRKVERIQNHFLTAIAQYDYKTDSANYYKNYREAYQLKITELDGLYQYLYDKEKMLSKEGIVDVKENSGQVQAQNQLKIDRASVENIGQMTEFGSFIRNNFPLELMEDSYYGEMFSCRVNFVIDVDGRIKKVKPSGSNKEFNLICAIFLYAIEKVEKPLIHDKKAVALSFVQPIKFIIE